MLSTQKKNSSPQLWRPKKGKITKGEGSVGGVDHFPPDNLPVFFIGEHPSVDPMTCVELYQKMVVEFSLVQLCLAFLGHFFQHFFLDAIASPSPNTYQSVGE